MKKLSLALIAVLVLIVGAPRATPAQAAAPTSGINVAQDYHARQKPYAVPIASGPGPQYTQLQTVPPTPGVTFQIAGQLFVTGADGTTVVAVPQPGTYDLQVITDTFHDPYRRVEFSRWLSNSYIPTRQIHLPSSTPTVEVGLDVYELVGEKFVGLDGKPVNPQRVTSFSIRSIQGDSFTFPDGQPRWLPASRVTRRRVGGLQQVPLLYTVTNVTVDGSNVVNKSQQQFYAQPNGTWTISLLLYGLRVQSSDALFGFAEGKQLLLQLPNGSVQTHPLDSTGSAQMFSLARGSYNVLVTGAQGISSEIPVALSKDQTVPVKIITYLDMAVVGGAGLLLAIALVVFGRLGARRSASRRAATERRVSAG